MTQARANARGRGGRRRTALGGTTILYGRNLVHEAVRGRRRVLRIWVTRGGGQLPEGAPPAAVVDRAELERICGSPEHQGIACEVERYRYADAESLLDDDDALVVALDEVQDPQNLGAICRSAECAGASGVVVPERRSADVTAAVCRASAGAVEHLALARVRNLADFLSQARARGAWVYGAEAGAQSSYTEPDYAGRTVLVLGSEGKGLRPRVRSACDQLVSLPLRGEVGSLNVSAAAAVLIYEALRQREGERRKSPAALDKSP
jgi:23S rRNA (guanosine2251-2'-O)-methyltransferase